jgi:predicted nuclease with TOPRIM domain
MSRVVELCKQTMHAKVDAKDVQNKIEELHAKFDRIAAEQQLKLKEQEDLQQQVAELQAELDEIINDG